MKINGLIRYGHVKNDVFRLADGVMVREEFSGALIYNVNTDRIVEVNQDVLYLLQLCDGKLTLKQVAEAYASMKEIRPGLARVIVYVIFRILILKGLVVNVV